MLKNHPIRRLFLKEFVRTMIINYPVKTEEKIYSPRIPQQIPKQITIPGIQTAGNHLQIIKNLINDRSVSSIECPGPEKEIIVNKFGRIKPIGLSLSAQEINKIIKEFSEKTKIPLIKGIFKAALGNIIITAVISEYVGTRFIIQKSQQPPNIND